ncbi:MAG: hypothetical protein AAF411_23910 [Myxococcota bacterium]
MQHTTLIRFYEPDLESFCHAMADRYTFETIDSDLVEVYEGERTVGWVRSLCSTDANGRVSGETGVEFEAFGSASAVIGRVAGLGWSAFVRVWYARGIEWDSVEILNCGKRVFALTASPDAGVYFEVDGRTEEADEMGMELHRRARRAFDHAVYDLGPASAAVDIDVLWERAFVPNRRDSVVVPSMLESRLTEAPPAPDALKVG